MRAIVTAALACMLLPAADKTKVESLSAIPQEAEFVCQVAGEIYVADSNGDHRTQITHQRKRYNHIAVSPDRKMVAAGRMDYGDTNGDGRIDPRDRKALVVLDLEHKEEWKPVPQADDACLGGVDWTPDGKYIVASMRFGRQIDIYRVHPDGTGLENLTGNLGALLKTPKPFFVSDVSVSFDGQWIVFTSLAKRGDLFRIIRQRIDGSEAHYVTDGGGDAAKSASPLGSGDFDPEFSPDGKYISIQRSNPRGSPGGGWPASDIMRVRLDTGEAFRLSPAGNQEVLGISDWSRDNRIIFSEWNKADRWSGPVLVNPDGTNYHRIEKMKGCVWVRWMPPLG